MTFSLTDDSQKAVATYNTSAPVLPVALSRPCLELAKRVARSYSLQRMMRGTSTDLWYRIPPVVSKGYQAKGGYQTINGLKTCTRRKGTERVQLSD